MDLPGFDPGTSRNLGNFIDKCETSTLPIELQALNDIKRAESRCYLLL